MVRRRVRAGVPDRADRRHPAAVVLGWLVHALSAAGTVVALVRGFLYVRALAAGIEEQPDCRHRRDADRYNAGHAGCIRLLARAFSAATPALWRAARAAGGAGRDRRSRRVLRIRQGRA